MKNNTKGFVAVLVVLVIGVVTLGSALFLTSWIRDRIPETKEEGYSSNDEDRSEEEKDLYDEDKYIGFTYGGSGWGSYFECAGGDVIIYNDGRAELIFEDEVVYETTVDIDDLKDKIDRDDLRTMKIKEDTSVCDGDSEYIYLYLKDGTKKDVGGYMVTTKKFNRYFSVLLSAFEPDELENALYEAKLIYAKANNICSYEGWDLVDYVAEITDIELGDLYYMAEGEVEIDYSEGYSEFAYIRISLFNGATETIEERFAERDREIKEVNSIPGYEDHEIAQLLKSENCIGVYYFFDDGWNGAKTRSMEMYLTTDDEGNEYLYFFG